VAPSAIGFLAGVSLGRIGNHPGKGSGIRVGICLYFIDWVQSTRNGFHPVIHGLKAVAILDSYLILLAERCRYNIGISRQVDLTQGKGETFLSVRSKDLARAKGGR
jgi:hypothetical protein